MQDSFPCPICDTWGTCLIFAKADMPRYNLQVFATRESALQAPVGRVEFRLCPECQFVFNAAFDKGAMAYDVNYESSRAHSEFYSRYIEDLGQMIDETFSLRGKTVLEIGCGDGQFLLALRRRFQIRGYGYDPSDHTGAIQNDDAAMRFIHGIYDTVREVVDADLIAMRHVLEHQPVVGDFLRPILRGSKDSVRLYIEVPAWEWIVAHHHIHSFHHEHCSYYSSRALDRALQREGFSVERMGFGFNNEYLQYLGVKCGTTEQRGQSQTRVDGMERLVERTLAFSRMVERLSHVLAERLRGEGASLVLWGAGGKGTTILNVLDLSYREIDCVVDANPRRQGTFIPRTGQRVVAPEALRDLRPRAVLLTNPLYTDEIRSQLTSLGLSPELLSLDDVIRDMASDLEP